MEKYFDFSSMTFFFKKKCLLSLLCSGDIFTFTVCSLSDKDERLNPFAESTVIIFFHLKGEKAILSTPFLFLTDSKRVLMAVHMPLMTCILSTISHRELRLWRRTNTENRSLVGQR